MSKASRFLARGPGLPLVVFSAGLSLSLFLFFVCARGAFGTFHDCVIDCALKNVFVSSLVVVFVFSFTWYLLSNPSAVFKIKPKQGRWCSLPALEKTLRAHTPGVSVRMRYRDSVGPVLMLGYLDLVIYDVPANRMAEVDELAYSYCSGCNPPVRFILFTPAESDQRREKGYP